MSKAIDFTKGLVDKINREDSIAYAYQLTYGLLLSIFPFLIFLMTLIGFLGLERSYVLDLMRTGLPEDVYSLISEPVMDLVENQRGGLLSASILATLYSASGGFRAFMKGMNKSMGFDDTRSLIYRFGISILWVIQLALTIVAALVGIVFGRQILDVAASFVPNLPTEGIIEILRIVVPIALLFGVLTLAYMFIPYINIKFKYAFPGAVFSTVVWIVFTVLFQFYVSNFANYSRFYGTLGAVIALLLWLLLTSIIMMVGASLNAYLIEIRGIQDPYISKDKEKKKEKLEDMKDEEDKKDDTFELEHKGQHKEKTAERDKIEKNIFTLKKDEKDDVSHPAEESKSRPERKFEQLKKRVEDTLEDEDNA